MTETIDQVFDAAVEDARKRWVAQPWTPVGQMIEASIKDHISAHLKSPAFREKIEALALDALLDADALPATVRKTIFDSSWNRDFYFKDVVKSAIEKNTAAIDKMMADLVTTNGEKIVTEMFRGFLAQAASKAAGSFIEAVLGAAGEQTRLAIMNTGHHY